jgi:protein-tyrosine-phosphatase
MIHEARGGVREVDMPVISNRLRLGIWCIVLMLAPMAKAQTTKTPPNSTPSTIVFVCEHGSGKSVIAAAHFNRLASERGLPYRAVSRGTKPNEAVADAVRTGLAGEGIDVTAWSPRAISDEDIRSAARVVSIATDLPAAKPFVKSKLLEWNDVPSLDQNYEAARKAIVERVGKLVESLAPNRK